jgi:hypothetical protein
MSQQPLEQRVERLERIVEEMQSGARGSPSRDDWRATIGAFSHDAPAIEIIEESLRLREAERQQVVSR